MGEYQIRPTEDVGADGVGVYVVDGLTHPILKNRQVTVMRGADDSYKDMVYEVRKANKHVVHGDVFVTPEDKYIIDGALVAPYAPPAPPADAADDQAAANPPAAAPQPGAPGPVQQVPVSATDSLGRAMMGNLELPWPGATTSDIVAAWDKLGSSLTTGNAITTIKVPGTDKRLVEIGYNNDQTRVLIEVGF